MPYSFKIDTSDAPAFGASFLEQWLADVLCEVERGAIVEAGAERSFAVQLAHVVRLFLELSGIPVFAPPEVGVAQASTPGHLAIELRLPAAGMIARDTYLRIIGFAADTCQWMARTPISNAAKESLFAQIEQHVIAPARETLVFGKSTMQILRSAARLGIPGMHLGAGVYQLGWGSKARRIERSIGDGDSAIARQLLRSKAVMAGLLRMAGLPAPVHVLVRAQDQLAGTAAQLGYPLVVKPADSGRGEGVTVDIGDMDMLAAAFEAARRASPGGQVIVERQATGVCHRIFVANGKLLYAVKRLPMSVVGDGVHSVGQLIAQERARQQALPPWQREVVPILDQQAVQAMQRAGWQPESVPGQGALVPLRRIESTRDGGVDEDVSTRLHPDNLDAALCAARLSGLEIAGVDMISTDIAVPWHENGAIVNEVNMGPLLGGGEISRAHLPAFLRDFVQGDGRIPLDFFAGREQALAVQHEYAGRGMRCVVVAASYALGPNGRPLHLPAPRIEDRITALLCRADVDAIAVIQQ